MNDVDGQLGGGSSKPVKRVPASKVTLYELIIRQLKDDGYHQVASSLSAESGIASNDVVQADSLHSLYNSTPFLPKQDSPPEREWTSVSLQPIPPLPADEPLLPSVLQKSWSDEKGTTLPLNTMRCASKLRLACTVAVWSHDGRYVACGSADSLVKVLVVDGFKNRGARPNHADSLGIADGARSDGQLGPPSRTFSGHTAAITALVFHPRRPALISGSWDATVKFFDISRGDNSGPACCLTELQPVRCMDLHPCGDFLLLGSCLPTIRMYDVTTLQAYVTIHQKDAHKEAVTDIKCTSDGSVFGSTSIDGSIRLWDAVSNSLINCIPKAHGGMPVTSINWSRGLRYFISSGRDGQTRLWDIRNGKSTMAIGSGNNGAEYVRSILLKDESLLATIASGGPTREVQIFSSVTGERLLCTMQHSAPCSYIEASHVDNAFVTAGEDTWCRVFDISPVAKPKESMVVDSYPCWG